MQKEEEKKEVGLKNPLESGGRSFWKTAIVAVAGRCRAIIIKSPRAYFNQRMLEKFCTLTSAADLKGLQIPFDLSFPPKWNGSADNWKAFFPSRSRKLPKISPS